MFHRERATRNPCECCSLSIPSAAITEFLGHSDISSFFCSKEWNVQFYRSIIASYFSWRLFGDFFFVFHDSRITKILSLVWLEYCPLHNLFFHFHVFPNLLWEFLCLNSALPWSGLGSNQSYVISPKDPSSDDYKIPNSKEGHHPGKSL